MPFQYASSIDPRRIAAGLSAGIPTAEEEALQQPRVDPIDLGVAALTGGAGVVPKAYSALADGYAQYMMGSDLPYAVKLPLAMAGGLAVGRAAPKDAVPGAMSVVGDDPAGLNVVSLFDGIGGLAEAAKRADVPVRNYTAYEIDPRAAAVASRNHPKIAQRGDVREFSPPDEPIDLLCGGFPCQDLSRGTSCGCRMGA